MIYETSGSRSPPPPPEQGSGVRSAIVEVEMLMEELKRIHQALVHNLNLEEKQMQKDEEFINQISRVNLELTEALGDTMTIINPHRGIQLPPPENLRYRHQLIPRWGSASPSLPAPPPPSPFGLGEVFNFRESINSLGSLAGRLQDLQVRLGEEYTVQERQAVELSKINSKIEERGGSVQP